MYKNQNFASFKSYFLSLFFILYFGIKKYLGSNSIGFTDSLVLKIFILKKENQQMAKFPNMQRIEALHKDRKIDKPGYLEFRYMSVITIFK